MASRPTLVYSDYRPIKQGDKGWTPQLEKARNYYSPSRPLNSNSTKNQNPMPVGKFQYYAKGGTDKPKQYTEYRKERAAKPTRRYRIKRPEKPFGGVILKPGKYINYRERADFLKEAYVRRISEIEGVQHSWDDLPRYQQTEFWKLYHELVDDSEMPSYRDYQNFYEDYFDLSYDELGDMEYGPTP
jgi:hypothetical protein